MLAVVNGRPILLSEVETVEAVRDLAREAAVDALIDEHLMFREAARLPVAAASATATGEDVEIRKLLATHAAVAGRVAEADLRRLVHRQLVILKYVEVRFLPQVRVGDDVVREAFETEYSGRADAPSLADATEGLRQRLVRKDLDARIESWVKELRAAAQIRYNR